MATELFATFYTGDQVGADKLAVLSREHDILRGLLKGSPDKGIARALSISAWTVHTHLKNNYEKLGVRSRTEAVIKYLDGDMSGVVNPAALERRGAWATRV